MFRNLKRRVKNLNDTRSSPSSGVSNQTHEHAVLSATNLDTPRRETVNPVTPAVPSRPTLRERAVGRHRSGESTSSQRSSGGSGGSKFRRGIREEETAELVSKLPHLVAFDKCIETSDALTATSAGQESEHTNDRSGNKEGSSESAQNATETEATEPADARTEAASESAVLNPTNLDATTTSSSSSKSNDGVGGIAEDTVSPMILAPLQDKATGLPDCSLLVSPEGDLLLVPTGERPERLFEKSSSKEAKNDSSTDAVDAKTVADKENEVNKNEQELNNKDASASDEDDDDVCLNRIDESSPFSELILHGNDDYESAIFLGNDLTGDKTLNRFTAKGWSIPATSLALLHTGDGLHALDHFCEQVVLSRKESAARTAIACDNMAQAATHGPTSHTAVAALAHSMGAEQWEILDPKAASFDWNGATAVAMTMSGRESLTPQQFYTRTGPFTNPHSSLQAAKDAVQQYHADAAQLESDRWRQASLDRKHGVLSLVHEATDRFDERHKARSDALVEASRRALIVEERLRKLKKVSHTRWDAVAKTEEKVTKRLEAYMQERQKEKQKARLKQLRETQRDEPEAPVRKMSDDVWDLVSSVADSMDHGSFEPVTPLGNTTDAASIMSDEASTTSSVLVDPPNVASLPFLNATPSTLPAPAVALPMIQREQVEHELGLPQLRTAALKADEDIRDMADLLLNILANLDTCRRSARLAAETCLVSAANAQTACLRQMVQLERESLQERLANLDGLDEVINDVDVRKDLDIYISADRKHGGQSHLGEDDDGGIASALAILSSHVDGSMGNDSSGGAASSPHQTNGDTLMTENSEKTKTTSPPMLVKAVDYLLTPNDLLTEADSTDTAKCQARSKLLETTDFLCSSASGASSRGKGRRSTLCYALNAKRGRAAEVATQIQFEALVRVFEAVLDGCLLDINDHGRGGGSGGGGSVSNAKMCMMLAQTFFKNNPSKKDVPPFPTIPNDSSSALPNHSARDQRVYIKSKLMHHPIWSKDGFWDIALSQQLAESLTHSGVMSNFDRQDRGASRPSTSEWTQTQRTRWFDLNYTERAEAASQAHAVVFAQLGALAHSMMEFGCGLGRSCAFVRRMSVRNQLPSSHRTMLLMHLMARDDAGKRESHREKKE